LGLGLEDVRQRIAESTINGPKGTLNSERSSTTLDTNDQLHDASEFGDVVLASRNGASVRIKDVGTVVNGVEDVKQSAWVGQHRAVLIDVHKQVGYNINETVLKVRAALPTLQQQLPASAHMILLGDRTQTIRSSVKDVQFTLMLSCVLVVLVVYAFLRNVRATLIPAVAIPLSLLGTLAAMYGLGYTLDNVSLMALTISVGFVIDDAIVMMENILRHIENGEEPIVAAEKGSREIGFTIVSMTLSLAAVFIPILFIQGVVGRLFREFADTAAIAILISGAVSLSVTPMLCAHVMRRESIRQRSLDKRPARLPEHIMESYRRSLRWVLSHQPFTMCIMLATLLITVILYIYIPKGFFPQQDNGLIAGVTEASPGISAQAMVVKSHELAERVRQDEDVQQVYYWVEGDPSTNVGRMLIDLKPFGERRSSVYEVIRHISARTRGIPEITLHMQARQDLTIGARVSKTQYQYTLRDSNLEELRHWTPIMLKTLRTLPELQDVEGDIEATAPRINIVLDRSAMARLGITVQAVDDTLYDAFGQRQVANTYTQVNVYRVILEVAQRFQVDESALSRMYVSSRDGRPIPLGSFSHIEHGSAPLTVNHDGQFPAVTLSFNLTSGKSLGDAIDTIRAKEHSLTPPVSLTTVFAGTAQAFEDSLANQPFLIASALLVIFIVLGVLYESAIHPITIMSTLPSACVGGLLALLLLQYDFSLIALIGVILLIGIVKKNGIMMVDVAISLEATGLLLDEAIYQACLLRFRPIMMTTMAALLSALPLAFGSGAGSELRRPLGVAMVGGLLLSQVLTLYTTPVVYLYLDRFRLWAGKFWKPRHLIAPTETSTPP
jgi:multidrug efflux pump subunit AcrB